MKKLEGKLFSPTILSLIFLILSSSFSLAMVIARVIATSEGNKQGDRLYLFMFWNLFLAWIPFALSFLAVRILKYSKSTKWMIALILIVWLAFYPNGPYLITDLIHLRSHPLVPLWYDAMMLFSFAWNGVLLSFISLNLVQNLVTKLSNTILGWVFVTVVLALTSFGIYLGRFPRWNSWDIITNPDDLFLDVLDRILNPFAHPRTIIFTLMFAAFLIVGYLAFVSGINLIRNSRDRLERGSN